MSEIEELEELQLQVEALLYKSESNKLVEVIELLEITGLDTNKSKIKIIKGITKEIEAIVDGEDHEAGEKISLVKNIVSKLDDTVMPPLEKSDSEKVLLELQNTYAELKKSQEKEMNEILQKLADAQKSTSAGSGAELKTTGGEPSSKTTGVANATVKKSPEEPGVVNIGKGTSPAPLFRREFKISGQIGDPGQTDKLTFVSLTHQIDVGIKKDYTEGEVIDAIIRAISPHSSLRSYVESLQNLTLAKLRKILRVHYREKTASELYHQLATTCQAPKENPQQFLLRALDIRNKVIFSSQEDDCEFNYGIPLIQNTFLKSFETGLRDDILTTNLRPTLRSLGVSDEELMKQVNELASHQAERQTKLGTERQRNIKVAFCGAQPEEQIDPAQLKSKKDTPADVNKQLLVEIREIKSEIATLKERVDSKAEKSSSSDGRESKPQGYGRGRGHFQKFNRPRGCPNCQAQGSAASCRHCFSCGGINHFAYECPSREQGSSQGNDSRLFPGDRK